MVDYASLLATAQRLITANGRSVTFISFAETVQDPAKPWLGPRDPRAAASSFSDDFSSDFETGILVSLINDAVFVEPGDLEHLGHSLITEDLIKRSTKIMLVSPGALDLSIYEEVIDGSERWKITGQEFLKPGDTQVLAFVGVAR